MDGWTDRQTDGCMALIFSSSFSLAIFSSPCHFKPTTKHTPCLYNDWLMVLVISHKLLVAALCIRVWLAMTQVLHLGCLDTCRAGRRLTKVSILKQFY